MVSFDPETLDRWKRLGPEQTWKEMREALFKQGVVGSEDYQDACEELVDSGLLSWEEIEGFERR